MSSSIHSQQVRLADIPLSCFECSSARETLIQEVKGAIVAFRLDHGLDLEALEERELMESLLLALVDQCDDHLCLQGTALLCTTDVHDWAQAVLRQRLAGQKAG
jgi:hypothetical protein